MDQPVEVVADPVAVPNGHFHGVDRQVRLSELEICHPTTLAE